MPVLIRGISRTQCLNHAVEGAHETHEPLEKSEWPPLDVTVGQTLKGDRISSKEIRAAVSSFA